MEKEFIPYEQALALKELGFDEECFSFYNTNEMLILSEFLWKNSYSNGADIVAPTFAQAFRWFREKYNLKGHVEAIEYSDGTPDIYHWSIFNKCNSGYDQLTYEGAELECLKKLIEIVVSNEK
jgi:hypothetical protein